MAAYLARRRRQSEQPLLVVPDSPDMSAVLPYEAPKEEDVITPVNSPRAAATASPAQETRSPRTSRSPRIRSPGGGKKGAGGLASQMDDGTEATDPDRLTDPDRFKR